MRFCFYPDGETVIEREGKRVGKNRRWEKERGRQSGPEARDRPEKRSFPAVQFQGRFKRPFITFSVLALEEGLNE